MQSLQDKIKFVLIQHEIERIKSVCLCDRARLLVLPNQLHFEVYLALATPLTRNSFEARERVLVVPTERK